MQGNVGAILKIHPGELHTMKPGLDLFTHIHPETVSHVISI